MLTELRIRNFAIIESVTLPLATGFNVLSGETGAGKSIIVGALGFLLGERANSDLIRTGSDKATVEGTFEIADRKTILAAADERGIEVDGAVLVLKREISSTGRGRAWVNGTSVTAAALAEIGRMLVNLHGQHEAQTLLDPDAQRMLLDKSANADDQLHSVAEAHSELSEIQRHIKTLSMRKQDAEKRADYLRHVCSEIEAAKLVAGEDATLEEEARIMENTDELRSLVQGLLSLLGEDESGALPALSGMTRSLAGLKKIDSSTSRFQELYDNGFYALDELSRSLSDYLAAIDLDPDRLANVRRRRDMIYELTRKYGPTLDEVIETGRKSRTELDLVETGSLDIGELKAREKSATDNLTAHALKLTEVRKSAARKLSKSVDAILPDLGMGDGKFSVRLVEKNEISSTGAEDVEFLVTLNVGHDARPLAKVASGGELSRVMLALKTILARADEVPTLIFDEVDAGIGGKVGLQVGDMLRRVAEHHQVFAISHLPQIAARAHHHMVVAKAAKTGVTSADIAILSGKDRVTEIARMLGGDPESKVSQAHAKELLSSAAA
ncbi:MAG: DNA repair protein RecN [Gemmatimonadaceae bacterium]|nr:DNA repair protein RecN [Gemmatimonadaceae bacterium]